MLSMTALLRAQQVPLLGAQHRSRGSMPGAVEATFSSMICASTSRQLRVADAGDARRPFALGDKRRRLRLILQAGKIEPRGVIEKVLEVGAFVIGQRRQLGEQIFRVLAAHIIEDFVL
jgi:hypothetical protein